MALTYPVSFLVSKPTLENSNGVVCNGILSIISVNLYGCNPTNIKGLSVNTDNKLIQRIMQYFDILPTDIIINNNNNKELFIKKNNNLFKFNYTLI